MDRSTRGLLGALAQRSRNDPLDYTKAALRAFIGRFIDLVDPDRVLDEDERLKRALALRKAHYVRMGIQSGEPRRPRKVRRTPSGGHRCLIPDPAPW
ncbi:MAG: hypothetical protein WEB00_00685 [Dehalococcoidia bacterium]